MAGYAAFLKGMNLGKRRITNAELTAAMEELGLENVRTFRASGNVVFDVAGSPADEKLAKRIETGLEAALGYPVATFVRSAAEVQAIATQRPFETATGAEGGKLQVALLADSPARAAAREVASLDGPRDRLAVHGRELYWLPIGPMSSSELDLKAIERLLGAMTVRTIGTIEQMAARLLS